MSAVISPCGQYRYMLTRGNDQRYLVFVMLNPSTADATTDDATIRRCNGFAETLGYTGIIVLNLYAFRATKPADLWLQSDPVGEHNDGYLELMATGGTVVCAWGANAKPDRVAQAVDLMRAAGSRLMCLGVTQAGAPRHPLYVRKDQPLIDWSPS